MQKNVKKLEMPENKKPTVSEKPSKRLKKARKKHIDLYYLAEKQIENDIYYKPVICDYVQ